MLTDERKMDLIVEGYKLMSIFSRAFISDFLEYLRIFNFEAEASEGQRTLLNGEYHNVHVHTL
jgi:hypothetical protein